MTRRTGDTTRRASENARPWQTETTVRVGARVDHPTGGTPSVRPHVETQSTARLRAPSDSTGIRTTPTASVTVGTGDGGPRVRAGGGMEVEVPLNQSRDRRGKPRSELDAVLRAEGHIDLTTTGGSVDVGGGVDVGAGLRGRLPGQSGARITGGPFFSTEANARGTSTTVGFSGGVVFKPTAESADEED